MEDDIDDGTETVLTTDNPGDKKEPEDRGDVVVEGEEHADQPGDKGDPKATTKPEDKPEDKGEARIPKSRFDEVNERMKKAEDELAKLKAASPPAAPAKPEETKPKALDLDAKEEEYVAAVQAGDAKKAAGIRREINAEISRLATEKATADISAHLTEREQTASLNKVVAESLEKYPFLNDASDAKNEDAINDVIEWRDFFASKGHPLHVALQKAVDKIAPDYVKPDPDEGETKDPAEDKGNVRQIEARRRNAAASNAQPAQMNGVGERASAAGRVDVSKMTDDEFEKLPDAEKKRLRGDSN